MEGHYPEAIRNRIEWRLSKNGTSYERTRCWSDAPLQMSAKLPNDFTMPVIYSESDSGDWTVIGVDEIGVFRGNDFERILLDDVEDITAGGIRAGFKANLEELNIRTKDIEDWRVPTEKGSPAFSVWNIVLMLARMQRRG